MCAPCERVRRGSDAATLARIIHECRRQAFETEARRGFSQVRPWNWLRRLRRCCPVASQTGTGAKKKGASPPQSVEVAEREKPHRAGGSGDVAAIHE